VTSSLAILALIFIAATAFGLWRQWRDGRMRDPRRSRTALPAASTPGQMGPATELAAHRLAVADLGSPLGERATLVQFSTAFCQPCRATRRILDEVAGMVPGTLHVEVDAESHLELVRRLDIRRTPTTLILDADGVIAKRASGLPRKADVIAALAEVIRT